MVDGKMVNSATSIIGYDEGKKKIVASVFSRLGAIAHAEEVLTKEKDVWVFNGRASLHGMTIEDRYTLTKVNGDTFTAKMEIKEKGAYELLDTSSWKRVK